MKLCVHRYAEDFWDDSDYTEEQLDTEELRHKLTEIALELKEEETEKADSIFNAIKLIERLEWIDRVLKKEIER